MNRVINVNKTESIIIILYDLYFLKKSFKEILPYFWLKRYSSRQCGLGGGGMVVGGEIFSCVVVPKFHSVSFLMTLIFSNRFLYIV